MESLLLTTTAISTFANDTLLTNASGFFFARGDRLFLVTSRHVLFDEPSGHAPDRIEIELHDDPDNLAQSTRLSIPLYKDGVARWRQAVDGGGEVDVAALEVDKSRIPPGAALHAFTEAHLQRPDDPVAIGTPLLIVGFPLGFHDHLHHMPVARHAGMASWFGLRFQGMGYFLTDARTHRGTSGAPVAMRVADADADLGQLPWKLLGVHSGRLDLTGRDVDQDEALGLNCAWYADILITLTEA